MAKITAQSVQSFGADIGQLFAALGAMARRRQMESEIDQARLGATNFGSVPIPGNPLAPMQPEAQAPTGFDQARFIQNLLPLLGRNPQAAAPFQATMALQPEPFTASAGAGIYERNKLTGKVRQVEQVPKENTKTNWAQKFDATGNPVTAMVGSKIVPVMRLLNSDGQPVLDAQGQEITRFAAGDSPWAGFGYGETLNSKLDKLKSEFNDLDREATDLNRGIYRGQNIKAVYPDITDEQLKTYLDLQRGITLKEMQTKADEIDRIEKQLQIAPSNFRAKIKTNAPTPKNSKAKNPKQSNASRPAIQY